MNPDLWNGFFIGWGLASLLTLMFWGLLTVIVLWKLWRHGKQLYRRFHNVSLKQEEDGEYAIEVSSRKRFIGGGQHVSIHPDVVRGFESFRAELEDLRAKGDGSGGDSKNSPK